MMGRGVPYEGLDDAVVTKTTSAILVLPEDGYRASHDTVDICHMLNRARSACIQCTQCTQLCPRHLLGQAFSLTGLCGNWLLERLWESCCMIPTSVMRSCAVSAVSARSMPAPWGFSQEKSTSC